MVWQLVVVRASRVVAAGCGLWFGIAAMLGVSAAAEVSLTVTERQGVDRRHEPITCGVPIPKGELTGTQQVRLLRDGREIPAQFRAAGLWRPGNSIRWLLVDCLEPELQANQSRTYTLQYGDDVRPAPKPAAAISIEESDDAYTVHTGKAVFRISRKVFSLFDEVKLDEGTVAVSRPKPEALRYGAAVRGLRAMVTRPIPAPANKGRSHLIYVACAEKAGLEDYTLRFTSPQQYEVRGARSGAVGTGAYLKDFASSDGAITIPRDAWLQYAMPAAGDVYTFRTVPAGTSVASEGVYNAAILERGPLRSCIRVKGSFGPAAAPVLEYTAWYHFYAGSGRVKLAFTLENNHHGGRTSTGNAHNADIGGTNCVFFDDMSLRLPLALGPSRRVCLAGAADQPCYAAKHSGECELYQDSSGGGSWNRYRDAKFHPRPNSDVSFRGYRLFADGAEVGQGDRAIGGLDVAGPSCGLTVAVLDFWQNSPKSLAVGRDGAVQIGLFPGRYAGDFPLRSGEHKTHELLFDFHAGAANQDRAKAVALAHSDPLRLEPAAAWFAKTLALGRLHPEDMQHYRAYEVRNLSTIGVFPEGVPAGPSLISRREENQFYGWMDWGDVSMDFEAPSGQWGLKYDLDYQMAQQYARTLRPQWWQLFAAAARHVRDIDIHHQPHYPGLHYVKGGSWAHSLHAEPGHKNPHRNYNHFTKDLCFGARGTATFYYLSGDWKSYEACLELAENAMAQYMSPQQDPGPQAKNNRMGSRGDACTLNRLLEGYLLCGDERFLERARWQIGSCAFDGKPPKHEAISLWSSVFYMAALARYVELFPDDAAAKSYFLAHVDALCEGTDPEHGILYTITPQPDGRVVGKGTCSHYNIMAADVLAFAHLLSGRPRYLQTARRCFDYGVANACWAGGPPTYFQVHSANGATHGNVLMSVESSLGNKRPLKP